MVSGSIKKFALRWGPAILMIGLIFLFSSIPMRPHWSDTGSLKLNGPTLLRKSGHLLEYGLLALALKHSLRLKSWKGIVVILSFILLFAMSDEFHQSFVPGRSARLIDVGIDMLGAVVGLWIGRIIQSARVSPG
jgi:VanZ family protein